MQIPQFLALAFANFILGWLWYSPAAPWFKTWVKGTGLNPDPAKMSDADKARMPFLFGGAIVSSVALSYVLQVVVRSLNAETAGQGASIGLALWAGLVLPVLLGTLWEGRKAVVVAINAGNYLVVCTVFAGILAVWR
ncbi:MAG: DUF1761 domain-containing protein [Vicinamibacterales bacterium]